jgi:hypothetical protein
MGFIAAMTVMCDEWVLLKKKNNGFKKEEKI